MYPNILSAVTQFLTPGLIAKIASLLGLERAATQKTVDVAVPALLSGLANLAGSPEGARQLSDAIAKQPENTLANLAEMLGGSARIADGGKSLLSSLLGGGTRDGLVSAVSKYAGTSEAASGSVLGMLAPAVLGIIGRKQREDGLSTSDLAEMLTTQKKDFIAAMPAGLNEQLGRIASSERVEPRSTATAARSADTVRVGTTPATAQSSTTWAYWAIPLAALAALGWYLLSGDRPKLDEPVRTTDAQRTTVEPVQAVATVNDAGNIGAQLTETITVLQGHLQAVRDAGASVALPKLREMSSQVDRLTELASQLPAEARERMANAIDEARAKVKSTLDGIPPVASATPGLMPAIDALRSKLDALAGAGYGYFAHNPADWRSLTAYLSRDVYNRAGDKLGTFNDFLIAPDGRITAAVVGVGGFLGIGEKEVAVPFASIRAVERDNSWRMVLDADKETLKNAPVFELAGERLRVKLIPRQ